MKHSLVEGSTIVMTPDPFMTTEDWEKMTQLLLKCYSSLQYLKEDPYWRYVEMTDGFGVHQFIISHDSTVAKRIEYRLFIIALI